jgi:hypothetical protein
VTSIKLQKGGSSLLEVDDSESMDLAGDGGFPYHEGDNFQPPIIGVGLSDGVVKKIKLALKDDLAFEFDRRLAPGGCFFHDWKFLQ